MVRCAFVVLVVALTAAAAASAAPERRTAAYCSPSGDVCYRVDAPRNVVTFRLTLAARYFARYRLCVRPPAGAATCKSFPVRRVGAAYGGSVRWERNFPNRGPGFYKVTWRLGTRPLGPALTFRSGGPR
ncbi:MAG TPA: hypothetical protein VE615_02925 [Gaiellaceae bacterium]|nr:hypothetical protein [Gaiellaceae bacterium]